MLKPLLVVRKELIDLLKSDDNTIGEFRMITISRQYCGQIEWLLEIAYSGTVSQTAEATSVNEIPPIVYREPLRQ